jgi:molybdopterin-guanine dinucleotide biosynthesis protein A
MGGGDKALLMLGGETLIARAIARAKPQVEDLIISANGDPSRFAPFGLPVVADTVPGFLGPLAGILAGMEWMRTNRPHARWLASFACDCPLFPTDMVEPLVTLARKSRSRVTVAESDGRTHPVFAVWSAEITDTSETVLVKDGFRKVEDWISGFPHRSLGFSVDPVDPFLNVNTPGQLAFAEDFIARQEPIR